MTIPTDLACYEGGTSMLSQLPNSYLQSADLASQGKFSEAAEILCHEATTWKRGCILLTRQIDRKGDSLFITNIVRHEIDANTVSYRSEPANTLVINLNELNSMEFHKFVSAVANDLKDLRDFQFEQFFEFQTSHDMLDTSYAKTDFYKYYLLGQLADAYLNYVQKI
ncbi:hypothetical protein M9Y10_045646 [Tritrichomonas musculus]|uniref:DUF1837 domain-containing protein n=1 Tax=Tritrichomonas musculus TaxID=1915356 RepID=A0ABR2JW55_9EUKA